MTFGVRTFFVYLNRKKIETKKLQSGQRRGTSEALCVSARPRGTVDSWTRKKAIRRGLSERFAKFECRKRKVTTEMQLSVLRNQLSSALGATKQKHLQTNRFGRAFERNCFWRVVFSWWNFGVRNLSIVACFLTHLLSASRFFDGRISTEYNRFGRAVCRNYHRRVEIWMLEFRRKIIDFGVLFDAITIGVSKWRW